MRVGVGDEGCSSRLAGGDSIVKFFAQGSVGSAVKDGEMAWGRHEFTSKISVWKAVG